MSRTVATVEATAPCRADLAGGTLDIWPLGVLEPGAVTVNVAIPVRVRVRVAGGAPAGAVRHAVGDAPWRRLVSGDTRRDLTAAVCFALEPGGGLNVRVLEQAPVGSGLGGSSSYAVALARGVLRLTGRRLPAGRLVALLRDLEARVLCAPTGSQDHWAAVCGGCLAVHLEAGGERIERLAAAGTWLGERLTVLYSGITHHSGMVNWQVIRRRLDGEPATTVGLAAIAGAARRARQAVLDGDEDAVAAAVADEWAARRRLAPEVAPAELRAIEEAARAAGALAVKACGAGGGGSLLLWHRAGARAAVVEGALRAAPGGRALPAGVAGRGCRVRVLSDSSE